jgi:type I restriction enzyme S subunit
MNESNVPALRFAEFNEDWDREQLGDIAQFSKGKGISKADIVSDGKIECIRYGELYTRYCETIKEISSRTDLPVKDLVLSESNDIIIPASGESEIDIATASCLLKGGVALSGDINIIKTKNNGVFLAYYLNNRKKKDIASLAQGVSVVHLYSSQLKTLGVSLPSLPEQQKIASFLTAIDAKVELLTKKKALLEQYKKGAMQQLFSQQVRFKDENGNDFSDWEEKTLGEVGQRFLNGGTPSTSNIEFWEGSIPWITGADFLNQEVGNIRRFITQKAVSNSSTNVVQKGWLLLVTRTGVGKMAIAPYDVAISQDITGIQLKESVLTEYLFHYLSFKQQDLINQNQGTSINGIKRNDLLNIKIQIPRISEQKKIATFISSVDEKSNALGKEIELKKIFKKGLLQQLFV